MTLRERSGKLVRHLFTGVWDAGGKVRSTSVSICRFIGQHVVLSLLIGVITTYLVVYLGGPPEYVVYVVGDFNSDNQIASDVWQGVQETCRDRKLKIHGRSVVFEKLNDHGVPERARELAESLAASDRTLMVIGHMLTQQSVKALPVYLDADPPVPVLLTTETHPGILPPLPMERNFHPVFRLSAGDDQQAQEMFELATRVRANRFWIAEDSTNAVYSEFLARQLDRKIGHAGGQVMLRTPTKLDPKEGHWDKFFDLATSKLEVNALLYAGDWHDAVLAVQQLQRLQPDSFVAVLGDLAANRRLLNLNDSITHKIFLTHPLEPETFETEGYKPFGHDACLILQRLLVDIQERRTSGSDQLGRLAATLRLTDVEDARTALAETMERKAFTREQFSGMKLDETYGFDHLGRRENARFHHWRIYNGKFQRVEPLAGPEPSAVAAAGAENQVPCRLQPTLIGPRALPLGRPPTVLGDRVQLEWRGLAGTEIGSQVYEVRVSRIADGREKIFKSHVESLELEVEDWAGHLRWQVTAVKGEERCPSEESELHFFPDAFARLALTGKLRFGIPAANDGSFISMTDGDLRGYEIDLAREVAKKLGAEPVFYSYPWESLFWIPGKNDVDIIMGRLSIRSYRETDFGLRFSVPYFQTSQALVSRAGKPVTRLTELPGLRVIVPRGTTSETLAETVATAGLIQYAANMEEGIGWLRSGRGEVLLADHMAALDLCEKRALEEELQVIPVQVGDLDDFEDHVEVEEHYGFAIRGSESRLAGQIDEALCELLEKGQIDLLLRKWRFATDGDLNSHPAVPVGRCQPGEPDELVQRATVRLTDT